MTQVPFKQGILRTTSAPAITIDPEKKLDLSQLEICMLERNLRLVKHKTEMFP
jgi:hypothetical protein